MPRSRRLTNPYLELWEAQRKDSLARKAATVRALVARDQDQLAKLKTLRSHYTHKYAYAVPNTRAILTLRRHAPLIEIGAGTGYWAWLLRQLGTDIVCYDTRPAVSDPVADPSHTAATCWTEVLLGDETALDAHPDHTLFLCWPPHAHPMGFRTLQRYRGRIFLYVGEVPLSVGTPASTGDDDFFRVLAEQWTPVQTVPLPNWEFCWDRLYVFRRIDSLVDSPS